MLSLIARIQRMSGPRSLMVATIAFLALALGVMQPGAARIESLSNKPLKILDLQFGFSPEQASTILADYTPESRKAAAQFLLWADTLYPLVYGVWIALLMAALFRNGLWRFLVLLPFLVVIVDFGENFFLYKVLTDYPEVSRANLSAASVFNTVKWSLLALAGLFLLTGTVLRLKVFLLSIR